MANQLWGKYRAEVVDVNDPEQRGRILVKSPGVLGDYEIGWAEACMPVGIFNLPSKGDFVYIEFERGNIGYPVWVGTMLTNNYVKSAFFPNSAYDPSKKIELEPTSGVIILPDGLLFSDPASVYPIGISITQVTATSGFPTGGTLETVKSSDVRIYQILVPKSTEQYFYFRHTIGSTGWGPFFTVGSGA